MSDLLPLQDPAAFDACFANPQPWWLLKHSSACGVSRAALGEVRRYLAEHPQASARLVVVQEQRDLCRHIAERTGHTHQSPQVFLLAADAVRWHASHWSITAAAMAEATDQA